MKRCIEDNKRPARSGLHSGEGPRHKLTQLGRQSGDGIRLRPQSHRGLRQPLVAPAGRMQPQGKPVRP